MTFGSCEHCKSNKRLPADLARVNPNPVVVVSFDWKLCYRNPAAERLFPDLVELGIDHPILAGLESSLSLEDSGPFQRDATYSGQIYAQGIHPVVETNMIHIYMFDITERRREQEEKKELLKSLARGQRLEALGRLAGGIAHDFNNALTIIGGYLELMASSLIRGDPMLDDINLVRKAANSAVELTKQLLLFSRGQKYDERSPVDLNMVIRGVQKMVFRILGEDIFLDFTLSEESVVILVDRHQLEQVIINLLINARDAMPSGGSLKIATGIVKGKRSPHIGSVDPDVDYALLEVRDTGVGISPDDLDKIFEPFFSTKPEDKGTGLGLSSVFGIVTKSNGAIEVHSKEGEGTTFTILWPLSNALAEPPLVLGPQRTIGGTESILLVEDDGAVAQLVEAILTSAGYKVYRAHNGREGLRVIQQGGEIELVVTDVIMPHMNGLEMLTLIRKQWGPVKALFFSGHPVDPSTGNPFVKDDPSDVFLSKPFLPDRLLDEIRALLDRSPKT